jgi:hypothetical protein
MTGTGKLSDRKQIVEQLTALENYSTPLEFMDAAKAIRQSGHADFAKAVERSLCMTVLGDAETLSALHCELSMPHARLYSAAGTSRKRLLIGFTGGASRLMMPLPIIMQALPRNADLLILYDPMKNHYRSGIWDGNRSLWELAQITAPIRNGYADTISLGTSGGGLPALRFAKLAGLRRGLSFGGRLIDDTLRILRRDIVWSAFDPLCACDERGSTELVFVYGADHSSDAKAARCAAVAANSHLIPISRRSDHNVLWQMQRMGCLPDLLEMAFSASESDLRRSIGAWNDSDLSANLNHISTRGTNVSESPGTSLGKAGIFRKSMSKIWKMIRFKAVPGFHE